MNKGLRWLFVAGFLAAPLLEWLSLPTERQPPERPASSRAAHGPIECKKDGCLWPFSCESGRCVAQGTFIGAGAAKLGELPAPLRGNSVDTPLWLWVAILPVALAPGIHGLVQFARHGAASEADEL